MIEIKKLSGILNKDDLPENIGLNEHIDALNIRFYGGNNGLTGQNIPGNTLITNSNLPSGSNECIGAFFDSLKQRIFWFNWNSNDRHGIYYYTLSTETISELLVCFTDSQTDILGFDLDYPVASIDIIYTTEDDGDILTWVARNKQPKALNILQAQTNIYGTGWLEKYLDVCKEPPSIPIKCAYEDDNSVTVNNLRNKLFKFKYRYWYRDNEKSVWSSQSEIPVPFNYTDPQTDTDYTKNSRIGCVIQTGDDSVVKIEISATENIGDVFGNFFSVIILNKSVLSISDNDVYIFRFYNNEAYNYVDLTESNLLFDRVPTLANSQSLLNGNVLIYGGITEGLDPVVPDVAITTGTEYPLSIDCNNILSVTQFGLEGFQTGENITAIVIGTIRRGQTFRFAILVGATTFTITYTAVVGDTAASVLVGLSASATGQGFTQVSITSDTLVLSRTGQILLRHNIATNDQSIAATFVINHSLNTVTINGGSSFLSLFFKGVQFFIYGTLFNPNPMTTVSAVVAGGDLVITVTNTTLNETITTSLFFVPPVNSSIPAYTSSSKENWAIAYYQDKGKTNGATTSALFNVNTDSLGIQKSLGTLLFLTPYINLSIAHQPPEWADYYHILRSANLTKSSYLFWVSDRTYKDDKYAYISVESINTYKLINPQSVISYEFVPGDRIKFYVLYFSNGDPDVVYQNQHDYEIYEEVINPDINGVIRQGQFLKIVLPTINPISGTFDFSNGITDTYNNYYIELYTPAKSIAENLNVYYEFSERYEVGDAGLSTRFHQGMLQNQSSDLVTPATFKFNKGDAWYRTRNINVGDVLSYDLLPGQISVNFIPGQHLTRQLLPNSNYVVAQDVVYQQLIGSGGFYNNAGWTLNVVTTSYNFIVTGVINFTANAATVGVIRFAIIVADSSNNSTTYNLGSQTGAISGQQITFTVNTPIVMPPSSKAFVFMTCSDVNFTANLVSGYLNWTQSSKVFEIGVVDQNFSDFSQSKVNSNGRALVVNPDEKTTYFPTLLRWGLAYIQNTNINQINRFLGENFDEIDRAKGDIQRLKARDRILRVFQNRAVGQFGVFARFIQNNQGDNQLVTTNDIITKNNINYYAGEYGLGDQYTGLVSAVRADYFVDPVRGYQVRLSADGFIPISEIYKGQFYIRNLLTPYNQNYLRTNGSKSKILGCYDYFDEQYVCLLQEGVHTTSQSEYIIPSYVFSFNERRNGYCSFYSYKDAEWLLSAEDVIYSWKNGQLYSHNNTTNYCNFFGVQYGCYITVVFNTNLFEKKTPQSVAELASEIWNCPVVYSNVQSYAGQRQETTITEGNFKTFEGMFEAAIRRDIHSRGGKVNGSFMKGNWLAVQFKIDTANDLVTLSEVKLKWSDSPLTSK